MKTKATLWSNYYSKQNSMYETYCWSNGKRLHVPCRDLKQIKQNEQILHPMMIWSIVYELPNNIPVDIPNNSRCVYEYLDDSPVPCVVQTRKDIWDLYQAGKLDKLVVNEMNPDRYIEQLKTPDSALNNKLEEQSNDET